MLVKLFLFVEKGVQSILKANSDVKTWWREHKKGKMPANPLLYLNSRSFSQLQCLTLCFPTVRNEIQEGLSEMLCVPVYSFDRWNFRCRRNFRSHKGFPCGSAGKESACNVGDPHWIPGLRRSSGEGNGYPLQYSGLENSMDYSLWDRKESDTTEQLSFHLDADRKEEQRGWVGELDHQL